MNTVTFHPSGKTVQVSGGASLLTVCREAGFTVSSPCAGKGLCGKCRVQILSGDIPADERQRKCLPTALLDDGWRASCIARVDANLTVADPDSDADSLIVLADFAGREPDGTNLLWTENLSLTPPTREDQTDDCARVFTGLKARGVTAAGQPGLIPLIRRLPRALRASGFACRAVGLGDMVLDIIPADQPDSVTGLAVDIGTTTVAVALCDMRSGAVLATASRANPQAEWGDDVVSRMEHATERPDVVQAMRTAIVGAVAELSAEACRTAAGRPPVFVTISANTVMNHLFLGVPPDALAMSPFVPAFREPVMLSGDSVGWPGDTPPLLFILPDISAYVGGDITSGILAHNLHRTGDATLLLDVGTNGEIALAANGVIHACATAAGPAFEGARIHQGMRAAAGAVSRVTLGQNGDIEIGVVDGVRPARGICGTGLLDAVAALRTAGVIDEFGQIVDDENVASAPEALRQRVAGESGQRSVCLDPEGDGVWLTQKDVREFQLAKGAVAAGVKVLAGVAGVRLEDIRSVLLAGGFGNYLNPASAVTTGLLPAGIAADRVISVGNASLAGARLCLLSEKERDMAAAAAARVRYVELSGRDDFQQAFAMEMLFPDA